ncbi:hypothetical protein OQJ59_15300 [Microbulbifer thermotolerans]|uniref:hypothetical protein n=1 Tax=Microbulbifer thermotolerans TaxID=252514 RepID=UPI00224AE0E9|nr:hypothetical protein [Microbulbifer thermotolerans]MCX2842990.1 hypothetical protein [Microbulbifer thermotolerans]
MFITQSDCIALAAVGVSLLSALYAKWAANEAKKANDISLHVHKVEIYEEVVSFSDCFRGLFSVPTAERLEVFKKKAVQRAEVYLSEEVYLQLKEIYKHCSESEVWLSIAESEGRKTENTPSELEVRHEYKSVLNLLYPVIKSIKSEAKLNHA